MTAHDRLTTAVAVALCAGALVLTAVSSDRGLLWRAVLLVLLVQSIAIASRHLRVPASAVPLVQLVVMAVFAYLLSGVPLSGPDGWGAHVRTLLDTAVLQIQSQVAPLEASPQLRLVLLLLLGLVTVITYVLAVTLEAPAWTLAALTTLYVIPAITLPRLMHWWHFGALALGFLVVLATATGIDNAAWSRNVLSRPGARASGLAAWQAAAWIAVPATVGAVLLGLGLPVGHALDLTSHNRHGQGPIEMSDPLVDLTRDLTNQSDQVVLSYKTSNDAPIYLRTAALTRMTESGWQLSPLNLKPGNPAAPPGRGKDAVTITTKVSIGGLDGQYLPAPYAPREISLGDDWAYDPVTLTVISTLTGTEAKRATRNLQYTVVSAVPTPDAATFATANSGPTPDPETLSLPPNLPAAITALADSLGRQGITDAQKAIAIQKYLADPNRFTYSTRAPKTTGSMGAMESFLLRDHSGYCIHFASAMALLARIEGVPSRIAVGFLPGTRNGDHFDVRAGNAHAWPELWFADYGWVRFEPTAAVAPPPDWTDPGPKPSSTPSHTPSHSASSRPSTSASAAPTASASATPTVTTGTTSGGGFHLPGWIAPVLTGLGIAALAVLVLLTPWTIRVLRRRRRLQAVGPDRAEAAWAEIRDTLLDDRRPWPPGSPRQIAATVRAHLGTQEATASLDTIAGWVERGRYAPSADIPPLTDDLTSVLDGLSSGHSRWRVWRARLWPRSLWRAMMERFTPGDRP